MTTSASQTIGRPALPASTLPFDDIKRGATAVLWSHIFGGVPAPLDDEGNPQPLYIAAFSGKRVPGTKELQDTTSRYWKYGDGRDHFAVEWIAAESENGRETYVCAHLLTKMRRIKPNAAQMLALYVDGDGALPGPDLPQPTATVESSPGRHQLYFRLTHPIDPTFGEQLNHRLANAMQADMSGWDLTQLLRPAGTRNWKYKPAPTVEIISIVENLAYDPDELDRILPPLPVETTVRAEVKLDRSAAATPIGDRDQRARERMYAAKRGSEIQMLANGGSLYRKTDGSPDHSADDQSYANALAFWFDKDPARMAAEMWRSNRVRDKWNEVHSSDGSTYLEMTIGKAISACSKSFRDLRGHDAGDDPPQIQLSAPEQPIITDQAEACDPTEPMTLEAALARVAYLERGNLDRDDRLEMLTGIIADQQQVIAATRAERDQAVELRALDRRAELAKQRISRAWKSGQAKAIITVATVAPPIANAHQTDEPIITREMVAAPHGDHPATAGENLKVFDLEGSPIKRIPKTLGTKSLTAYQLNGLSSVEILEQMADLGERLKEQDGARPTTRAKRVRCERCPDGTTQTLAIICDGCGGLLQKRRLDPPAADNASETRALEPPLPPVDVLRTTGTRNACVAGLAPARIEDARASLRPDPPSWVDEWPDDAIPSVFR